MGINFTDRSVLFFCRLGFAGLSPVAPGTCGTALACVIAPFIFLPFGFVTRCLLLLAVLVSGALLSTRAEIILRKKDPGEVVIDELLGVWIVLLPFERFSIVITLLAFSFFRFFDILKPWPIRLIERKIPAGWGVMLDDALAGVYALVCVAAVHRFILPLV